MPTTTPTLETSRHPAPTQATVNGIAVAELRQSIDAIGADNTRGHTSWCVNSQWMGGTRSDHHIEGCSIGGQFVKRPFVIKVDEPQELAGTNQFANPQEYLLAALNACMMVGYTAVAALMGVKLTKLEVQTRGDIDLRGFLGIGDRVPAGYVALEQEVHIAGSGTPEEFSRLHDIVRATSPNFFNITRAVPVRSRMIVE